MNWKDEEIIHDADVIDSRATVSISVRDYKALQEIAKNAKDHCLILDKEYGSFSFEPYRYRGKHSDGKKEKYLETVEKRFAAINQMNKTLGEQCGHHEIEKSCLKQENSDLREELMKAQKAIQKMTKSPTKLDLLRQLFGLGSK